MKQSVDEKLIDLNQLNLISRGNQRFIEKMLSMFVSMAPKYMANLNEALQSDDWQKVGDLAHSLKPIIDTLNIAILKDPIRRLEKLARNEGHVSEIRDLIILVIFNLQLALKEVKEILHK